MKKMFRISDAQESLVQEIGRRSMDGRCVVGLVVGQLDSLCRGKTPARCSRERPAARLDCLLRWRTEDAVAEDRKHAAGPPSWIKITAAWRGIFFVIGPRREKKSHCADVQEHRKYMFTLSRVSESNTFEVFQHHN